MRRLTLLLLLALLTGCGGAASTSNSSGAPTAPQDALTVHGQPADLPLPSSMTRAAYETKLYAFLSSFTYRNLGWKKDKQVRDCGDYSNGVYYAPHQAVRIYYSPEVFAWLKNGRQGLIPDGAVIVKELYPPPAARYADPSQPLPQPQWAVMVRDAKGSKDGWFWSFYAVNLPAGPLPVDSDDPPFAEPNSGFGISCLRCHASAETEFTFSALENIEGEPGHPLTYADDGSWRTLPPSPVTKHSMTRDALFVQPDFAATYNTMTPPTGARALPGVTTSDVVAGHGTQFLTANQCMACHGGDTLPLGPRMMVDDKKVDVSPWAEWSWSMMGLAGRDPLFYAQLESETAIHAAEGQLTPGRIENFCLRCHGAMGQRQFHLDQGEAPDFTVERALGADAYGGLARDGISCMVCHQMKPNDDVPLDTIDTGRFEVIPRKADGSLTVNGPFENPTRFPMENSLGVTPAHDNFITESRLCASCHTVNLPILDKENRVVGNAYEQATYLEWVNSDFRDGGKSATSCQQCHMPNQYHGQPLAFKIASTHDQTYPITTFAASLAQIFLGVRDNYARHTLLGLNQFALEMFNQFPDLLGVRLFNPMSEVSTGLPTAIASSQEMATQKTATVKVLNATRTGSSLTARVSVTNLTGHRFPSGVGFRRAFLEVTVADASGSVVWGSGRTNDLGAVVDGRGQVLPSEFHRVVGGQQSWQPHYQTVSAENQVQIYEELTQDLDGAFTTSFLSRAHVLKDNRLLPRGWTAAGPAGFDPGFARATAPEGDAATDPDFTDGSGGDIVTYAATLPPNAQGPFTVTARLQYQSMPPSWLADRFTDAHGEGTQRLYYLAQHLDPSRTNFPSWKLPVATTTTVVP